jgi:hypothetical protein
MRRSIGVVLVAGTVMACGGTSGAGEEDASPLPGGSNPFFGNDPQPLPAQGAVVFSIEPASTAPAGASCPTSAFTSSIPDTSMTPAEALDADTFMHKVIDGEDGAAVSCHVEEQDGFVFAGDVKLGGRGLRIEGGTLSADRTGNATITVIDNLRLPGDLSSSEACVVNAMLGSGNNFQVHAGAMWAQFSCAAVEAPPSDACSANGFFVLENCAQE